jgi:hypothetical protein
VAKGAARDLGYGAVAGAGITAVDEYTDNALTKMAAGIGTPLVTSLAWTGGRKMLAKKLERSLTLGPSQRNIANRSSLMKRAGMATEQIGSETYNTLSRSDVNTALSKGQIASDTAKYTLKPWFYNLMDGLPYMGANRYGVSKGAITGDALRRMVGRAPVVGGMIARRLGIEPQELQLLSRLAEVIPDKPLDENGFLRLGMKDKDGNWVHGLEPEKARQAVEQLTPAAKNMLMAFVEPASGFHIEPMLPKPGQVAGAAVDAGRFSLDQVARRMNMDPQAVAANYYTQGHSSFVKSFGVKAPRAGKMPPRRPNGWKPQRGNQAMAGLSTNVPQAPVKHAGSDITPSKQARRATAQHFQPGTGL